MISYMHPPVPIGSALDSIPLTACKWCDTVTWIVLFCSDAEDAVHARDGYNYDGYTLRVEFPRGGGPGGPPGRGGYGGFRGGMRGGRGGGGGGGGGPASRRSDYRVLVSGMWLICWHLSPLFTSVLYTLCHRFRVIWVIISYFRNGSRLWYHFDKGINFAIESWWTQVNSSKAVIL